MQPWEELIETILEARAAKAKEMLEDWAREHGHKSMMIDLLNPALHEMGERWTGDFASMAHAYVAADTARHGLELFIAHEAESFEGFPRKGPVVMGNIEDDCHALGRQMVSTFLETDGWEVHDLGIDVEPERFVDEAEKIGAKVIGVSAMIYSTAELVGAVRREIDDRGLTGQIQLAAGGAVFRLRPELAEKVGADGSTADAFGASELFDRLWDQAARKETVDA